MLAHWPHIPFYHKSACAATETGMKMRRHAGIRLPLCPRNCAMIRRDSRYSSGSGRVRFGMAGKWMNRQPPRSLSPRYISPSGPVTAASNS